MQVGIAQANGTPPVHGIETVVELTYAAQALPWLVLQPDMQFIANPGAGQLNPDMPEQHLHNAWVAGLAQHRDVLTEARIRLLFVKKSSKKLF